MAWGTAMGQVVGCQRAPSPLGCAAGRVFGERGEDTPGFLFLLLLGVLIPPGRDGAEQRAPSSPPSGPLPPPRAPGRGCREGFRAETPLLQKQTPQIAFGAAAGAASLPNVPAGNRPARGTETILPTPAGECGAGEGADRGCTPLSLLGGWGARQLPPHCHLPPPEP